MVVEATSHSSSSSTTSSSLLALLDGRMDGRTGWRWFARPTDSTCLARGRQTDETAAAVAATAASRWPFTVAAAAREQVARWNQVRARAGGRGADALVLIQVGEWERLGSLPARPAWHSRSRYGLNLGRGMWNARRSEEAGRTASLCLSALRWTRGSRGLCYVSATRIARPPGHRMDTFTFRPSECVCVPTLSSLLPSLANVCQTLGALPALRGQS